MTARDATRLTQILSADPGQANATNSAGMTPLHLAAREGAVDMAALLIKNSQAAYFAAFLDLRTPQGKAALESGDLEKGYDVCTAVLKDDPGNEHANFAQGMASYSTERYSLAKLAFERVIEISPGNDRARAELGRTYLAMGNMELAAKYLREALAKIESEEVRRKIQEDLRQARKGTSRWRGHLMLNLGYMNDDNINVGPNSDTVRVHPLFGLFYGTTDTLTVQTNSRPLEAEGGFGSVAFSLEYDCGQPGEWSLAGDAAMYGNELSEGRDYESHFAQVRFGANRNTAEAAWRIPYKVAFIASGWDELVLLHGLSPRFVYIVGGVRDIHWQTDIVLEKRNFFDLRDRSGAYYALGQRLKQYSAGGKHNVSMGLQVFHDHTRAAVYEYTGIGWTIGADISLPWQSGVYARGRYATMDYSEREALAPETRSDTQNQIVIGLKKRFTPWWGIDVNYQQTDNNSTFTLYQYDRSVWTASTFFRF